MFRKIESVSTYIFMWLLIFVLSERFIANFYAKLIRPFDKNEKKNQSFSGIKILALSPERFRKDLSILNATEECEIYIIDSKWQTRIIRYFYDLRINEIELIGGKAEHLMLKKRRLREFYKKFLSKLYEKIDIDVVISAGPNYVADYDWGVVSDLLGKPFVLFNRENLLYCENMRMHVEQRLRRLGRFEGTRIFVHNNMTKESIVRTGYANEGSIVVAGCLRMDDYIKRIKNISKNVNSDTSKEKILVLFSFGQLNTGLEKFFYLVHSEIIKFASIHHDIKVIIKPKRIDKAWSKLFDRAKDFAKIEVNSLDNLEINDQYDAQELILKADVVTGYNSTTMFEALIAGKPVIIPCFNEVFIGKHEDNIAYGDDINIFNVAYTVKEYARLLLNSLNDSFEEKNLEEKSKVFDKWISNSDGASKSVYINELQKVSAI